MRGMMPPSEANGRNGDTLLVHMKPSELQAIHKNARRRGLMGVTRNPKDGRPEAWAAEADSVAAERDVANGGNVGFDTGTSATGGPAQDATDEVSLLDKAKNAVIGYANSMMSKDKLGGTLMAGMGPPGVGTIAGVAVNAIGTANVNQIEAARANGTLSEADYAAIQAGGTGTIKGGGLMGEDVQVGLHGANTNPDREGQGPGAEAWDATSPTPGANRAANYSGTRGLYLPAADEEGEWVFDPASKEVRWVTKERK